MVTNHHLHIQRIFESSPSPTLNKPNQFVHPSRIYVQPPTAAAGLGRPKFISTLRFIACFGTPPISQSTGTDRLLRGTQIWKRHITISKFFFFHILKRRLERMKIQCNACEASEAKVMCCADEAALCWDCDERVHAANKLAGKHQRVQLLPPSSSSAVPKCDICQEASGYFFCVEDRALFCRNCDVSIHTANPYVSAHRRFLLTGVRVGLEHAEPVSSVGKEQPNSAGRRVVESSPKPSANKCSLPFSGESNVVYSGQASKDPFCGGAAMPDWPLDDFFGFSDFNQSYGFTEHGSSKADSGNNLGSSESSPPCFPAEERLDLDGCFKFSQVPEISPSPPTASGLHWQRNLQYHTVDHAAFVPDIFLENIQPYPKRRRPA